MLSPDGIELDKIQFIACKHIRGALATAVEELSIHLSELAQRPDKGTLSLDREVICVDHLCRDVKRHDEKL